MRNMKWLVMLVTALSLLSSYAISFGSKGELVCDYSLQPNLWKISDYYLQYGEQKTSSLIKQIAMDSLLPFDEFRKTPSYGYMEVVLSGRSRLSNGFYPYELRTGEREISHDHKLIPVENVPLGYDLKVKIVDDRIMNGEVKCVDVWSDYEAHQYVTELLNEYYHGSETIDLIWANGRTDVMRRWIVLSGGVKRVYGYGSFRLQIEGTEIVSDKIYLRSSSDSFEDSRCTTKTAFRGIAVEQPDCWFNYRGSIDEGLYGWSFCFWDDDVEDFTVKTPGAGTLVVSERDKTLLRKKSDRAQTVRISLNDEDTGYLNTFNQIAFYPSDSRAVEVVALWGEKEVVEKGVNGAYDLVDVIYRGFVMGTGVYRAGEVTELKAVSGPGQTFDRWELQPGVSVPAGFEPNNPNLNVVVPDDWCGGESDEKRIFVTAYWKHDSDAYIGYYEEDGGNDDDDTSDNDPGHWVVPSAASVYDGYLSAEGVVAGTIQTKVAKPKLNRKTSRIEAKVTVTIQLVREKKITVKGDMNAATGVFTGEAKDGRKLSLTFDMNGVSGDFNGIEVVGNRNLFSSKDKSEKADAEALLEPWLGAMNMVCDGGVFTVTVAKKGKVTVKGTIDGNKVSIKATALIGEDAICIPVAYSKKDVELAFTLWLPLDGGAIEIVGLDGAIVGKAGTLKAGAVFAVDGDLAADIPGAQTSATDEIGVPYSLLPDGVSVSANGRKWLVADGAKAAKVKYDKKAGKITVTPGKKGQAIVNPSGLKLTYKAKDGSFKGSFYVYTLIDGKFKKQKANITGVLINGIGYGTATIKKFGSWSIKIAVDESLKLPDWAVGTFEGYLYCGGVGPLDYGDWLDRVIFTVGSTGKITMKSQIETTEWFSLKEKILLEHQDGRFVFSFPVTNWDDVEDGLTATCEISKRVVNGFPLGVLEGVVSGVHGRNNFEGELFAGQNVWGIAKGSKLAPEFIKNTTTTVSMEEMRDDEWDDCHGGYLTLEYGDDGKVTTTYHESENGHATATGSTQLVLYEVDGDTVKALLYTALKPSGRDSFGVLLFLSIDTSNGAVHGSDVMVEDYQLEED